MTPRILYGCHSSCPGEYRPHSSDLHSRHITLTTNTDNGNTPQDPHFRTAWATKMLKSGSRVGSTNFYASVPTMEIEDRVELPDGHLVNLSPRPQRQQGQYQAYRGEFHATELSATPLPRYNPHPTASELEQPQITGDIMFRRGKVTKLPVPNSTNPRDQDRRHQTPSPTGIPKPSQALSPRGSGPAPAAPPDKTRDQYWKRIRDKFEKESPLSQKKNQKAKESNRQASSNHASSWQQNKHGANSSKAEKTVTRDANARSAIPNPKTQQSATAQSARNGPHHPAEPQKKWRMKGGQWTSSHGQDTNTRKSERSDTTTDSSPRSHPSVSPVSAEDSSSTDWEDRFVVHMPSAKDPNPPMMTEKQIAEYQQSIERVHKTGGRMVDPNTTKPSPRNSIPEVKRSVETKQSQPSTQFKAYDGRPMQPQPQHEADSKPTVAPPAPVPEEHSPYYSPDEVGKNRISTIWEESSPSSRPKEKRVSQNDGSFLGCKEINGSGSKNPDEILLFASGEETGKLQPRPLAIGAKKRLKEKRIGRKAEDGRKTEENRKPEDTRKPEEKSGPREERAQTFPSTKPVQCSKQSTTMCQDPVCTQHEIPRSDSQGSEKENPQPTGSAQSSPGKLEDGRSEDDVFIITPTITRTMIPTPSPEQEDDKTVSALKPQGLRRPGGIGQSGTGEAVKAVRAKAQVISTPSGLRPATKASQEKSTKPSLTSSKTVPLRSIASMREKAKDKAKDKDKENDKAKDKEKGKDCKEKGKDDADRLGHQTATSIRGFIRTSGIARSTGLVRSPTEGLASILRNGTESLRHRAETLRNGSGSIRSRQASLVSQSSLPTRDNSESSRSEKSFQSARENQTPKKLTPIKKESPVARIAAARSPPVEKPPPTEKSPPVQPDKSTPAERSPTPEKLSARAERLEKFKEQARLRRATKVVEIAELDGQQVPDPKELLQPNITDVCDDIQELRSRDKDEMAKHGSNAIALSLIFEIVFVTVTHMHKFGLHMIHSPYAMFMLANILNMTRHCYHVFGRVYRLFAHYQATGTWPKAKNDQAISRFLIELLQAVVYLFVLGFGALVVGRAANYAFVMGSWALWFARPFTWTLRCVGRAIVG